MQDRRSTDRVSAETHRAVDMNFDIQYVFNVMLSRWKPILGVVILSGVFCSLYLSFQKPLYTASALVQLASNQRPLIDTESLALGRFDNNAAIQSEIDILKSPALIRRVVDRLELNKKEEFNSDLQPKTFVWKVKKQIRDFIKKQSAAGNVSQDDEDTTKISVTNAVSGNMSLDKNPLSYTVAISFTSLDAERAKNIANAIAEEYLSYQIESSNTTSRHAREWYTKRLDELRQTVIESERAVQEFSEEHNLFELDGKTLDEQQVSNLNSQLATARADLAQSEARLERARTLVKAPGGIESVSEVLNSVLIQNLRGKEADLLRKKSELSSHFGPKHPEMEQVTRELADLRGKIDTEIQKILAGMENELAISKVRVTALEKDLESMRSVMGDNTRVQLTQLKREADANRVLYESFLTRAKETAEAENIDQASAKIISFAERPLTPSWPRKSIIMAFFLMTGFCAGVGLAFAMELLNIGFTSPAQIEEVFGSAYLGMVPEISGADAGTDYMVKNSSSMYTESLRSIVAAIQFSDIKNPPRSVLVISALPQEGKGWLSISLGRVAAQAGKKVLLLDCDLHRPMVSDSFNGEPKETLNSYLAGVCALQNAIQTDGPTSMHYIASSPHRGSIQELLESPRMKELMDFAHAHYNLVLMDSPPVIGMSDVMFLSRLADTTILAVRWANTPRRIVSNALRTLARAHIKLSGIVLTRVAMRHYKRFEFGNSYYYSFYNSYYHDDAPEKATLTDSLKDKIIRFSART